MSIKSSFKGMHEMKAALLRAVQEAPQPEQSLLGEMESAWAQLGADLLCEVADLPQALVMSFFEIGNEIPLAEQRAVALEFFSAIPVGVDLTAVTRCWTMLEATRSPNELVEFRLQLLNNLLRAAGKDSEQLEATGARPVVRLSARLLNKHN